LKVGKAHWLRDKLVNIIVQVGRGKDAELPHVPMVTDFVTDPEHKMMWNVMIAVGTMGRPLMAPPGVSPDLVRILRAGFEATMKDAAYRAEMDKTRRELEPVGGEEVQQMLADVARIPQATLAKLNEFIKRQ
jgi:hypothetical protein